MKSWLTTLDHYFQNTIHAKTHFSFFKKGDIISCLIYRQIDYYTSSSPAESTAPRTSVHHIVIVSLTIAVFSLFFALIYSIITLQRVNANCEEKKETCHLRIKKKKNHFQRRRQTLKFYPITLRNIQRY